jgi:WD40 repeat protein
MTRLAWIAAACALTACRGDRAPDPTPPHVAAASPAPVPPAPVPPAAAPVAPITYGPPQPYGAPVLRQGHVRALAFVSPTAIDVLTWDGVLAGDPPDRAARNLLAHWQLGPEPTPTTAGTDSPITDAAFAPLAHVVAIATQDGDVALRDDDDFMPRWKTPLGARIDGVAIAPDAARVLAGDEHGGLALLDGATGAIEWRGKGLRGYASVLAWSLSGRYVAVGGDDDDVLVLDAVALRLHHPGPPPDSDRPRGVLSIAFAPDERAVATGGWDDTIRVFALPSGVRLREIKTPADPFALAYSPDGAWLVYGGRDHDLALWRARDGAPGVAFDASPGSRGEPWRAIAAVAFSADGKTLASGSWDGTIRLWDMAALARGQTGPVAGAREVAMSRDGATLITIGEDRRVIAWDVATGALRAELAPDDLPAGFAIAPDASAIARADERGLAIVELPSGTTRIAIAGDAAAVDARVAFSSDGARVLAQVDGHLRIHDARTGALVTTLDATGAWSLGFTDGDRAVWWLGSEDLHVVDAATGARRATVGGAGKDASRGALSPDGRALAVLDAGPAVSVWDVATGARRFTWDGGLDYAWSADSRTLAVTIAGGTVEIFDAQDGRIVGSAHIDATGLAAITALATGPHGELVAGTDDGVVRVWRPTP